ncbi:MAG: class I SAM-dependent methyltransferase [Sandaracinaceae bacterium]|nr:class I SAM-dependent methyltransferase [Sandaracinaceae bacterium]
MDPDRYYLSLAAAYVRGRLGIEGEDAVVTERGLQSGLRLHRFKRNAELPRVRRVIGILQGLGPSELLDVGSGRGTFLWPLLDALPGLPVTAVDADPERASQLEATARGWPALSARREDACAISFVDDTFDGATALEVLEHLPEPSRAARELARVVRRFVVATVPSEPDDNPEHLQLFTPKTLEALLLDAGFARARIDAVRGHYVAVATK